MKKLLLSTTLAFGAMMVAATGAQAKFVFASKLWASTAPRSCFGTANISKILSSPQKTVMKRQA